MKIKNVIKISAAYLLILGFMSCKVNEGKGGTGKISGTLLLEQYNDDYSLKIVEGPSKAEDVFIRYGTSQAVADRVRTSNTGYFEFPYLFPGNYTVYYFSKDSTQVNLEDLEVSFDVTLAKNEHRSLGELIKMKTLDYDEGSASIKGLVRVVNYRSNSQWPILIPQDTTNALEQEVYVTYHNHTFYDDRIRTQHDGTFYFNNLIPGKYKIFLYSDNIQGGNEKDSRIYEVEIESQDTVVDLGTILIHNL